jgi:Fanconi-associated nuclease 1
MVFSSTSHAARDLMLGSRNLDFRQGDAPPPAKRLKTFESTDGEDSRDVSGDETIVHTSKTGQGEIPDSDAESDVEDGGRSVPKQSTELEAALPPIKTDKEAIEAYEAMRMVDQEFPEDVKTRVGQRNWAHGKSSIYVDAFNLTLETVLDEEKHLFDEKELEIFEQWRRLEYEAQYL